MTCKLLNYWRCAFVGLLTVGCSAVLAKPVERLSAESQSEFRFEDVTSGAVKVWQGKQPVLIYHSELVKRTGAPAVGNRSSYVHPIYALDGEVITDDFPQDHYHHHGMFWGWPHVVIGDK